MSEESDAIAQFGQVTDVLLKTLKVPDAAINYIDGAISYEEGHAEHQSPVVTALEFGVAGLVSAAVVSAIGVEALGAGVLAIAGEEAAVGAAAFVDSTIAGSFPGLALAATGSDVVATVAQAVGTTAVGIPISKIVAEGFESWAKDVFHPNNLNITKSQDVNVEVNQGSNEVILSNSRNINVDSNANAYIIGDSYTAYLSSSSTATQLSLEGVSKSYFDNPDGTSEVLNFRNNGSEVLNYFSGGAGTGNLLARDVERTNGTSALTNFGPNGNPTTFVYSGPEGTGTIIGGNGDQGSSGGTGANGTTTFEYQGNAFTSTTDSETGLHSIGRENGSLSANIVVNDLPENYTGRISEDQSGGPYFVYTPDGSNSSLSVNGPNGVETTGIESNSFIQLTNGVVTSWDLLGDVLTQAGTNLHVESAGGVGSYSGDYATVTYPNAPNPQLSGVSHNLGSWTSA